VGKRNPKRLVDAALMAVADYRCLLPLALKGIT
jgi:hypothetical protein